MSQAKAAVMPPTVDIKGLLALISVDGDVIAEVDLDELNEIDEIRQIVIDTADVQISYTGS